MEINGGHPAHMAQLVEHVLGKDEVTGSIPVVGSIFPLLAGKMDMECENGRYL